MKFTGDVAEGSESAEHLCNLVNADDRRRFGSAGAPDFFGLWMREQRGYLLVGNGCVWSTRSGRGARDRGSRGSSSGSRIWLRFGCVFGRTLGLQCLSVEDSVALELTFGHGLRIVFEGVRRSFSARIGHSQSPGFFLQMEIDFRAL